MSLIDPSSNSVVITLPVEAAPTALAAVGTAVWVAGDTPQLTRLEASGQTRRVVIPSSATALAAGRGGLSGRGDRGRSPRRHACHAHNKPDRRDHPGILLRGSAQRPDTVYDGLLSYSKSPASPDTLVPDLALAIPAPQDGGLSYTFRLRPGALWTGKPVRASDFLRGLERAAQGSPVWAAYLGALPGALACQQGPRCDLRRACSPTTAPAGHAASRTPDPDLLHDRPPVRPAPPGGGITPGTGPYRSPGWCRPRDRARAQPVLPGMVNRRPATRLPQPNPRLLRRHSARRHHRRARESRRPTFDTPTPTQLNEIELRSPALLHTQPLPDTDYLDLNTHAGPFNDLRVRQALNFAIDRNAIAAPYGDPPTQPTCQIIPATIPGHVPYCPYTRAPSSGGVLVERRTSRVHAG